jgi:hypothetical protein
MGVQPVHEITEDLVSRIGLADPPVIRMNVSDQFAHVDYETDGVAEPIQ